MNRIFFCCFVFLLVSSCVQKRKNEKLNTIASKIVSVSDNEYKGINEVLDFYGGNCIRHKGYITQNGVKQTYFELELEQSRLLEKLSYIIEMPASNIALIFYENLNNDEKEKYSLIRVTINFMDSKKSQFDFPINILETVTEKSETLNEVSNLMKISDYSTLSELFYKENDSGFSNERIKDVCNELDTKYGKIDSLQFQGFSFFKSKERNNKDYLILAGIQYRSLQNIPLVITIDSRKETIEESIINLKFEF
jgi:hypothetical protein